MDNENGVYDDSRSFGIWPTIVGVAAAVCIIVLMFALATGMT